MPVIVVTRLRLRDPALLDEFFTDAVAAIEQAQQSQGNLGADALADANNAWWSVTAWQDRSLMQGFVDSQPHLGISTRLDHYCDEATFVDWEQASPDLPDWRTSWRHLTADGKVAALLTHAARIGFAQFADGGGRHRVRGSDPRARERRPHGARPAEPVARRRL